MPNLYVMGGANGAGKTTAALGLFPKLGLTEDVNADAIRGLEMNEQTALEHQQKIEAGVQAAIAEAMERHRLLGQSIAVSNDNGVVKIIPAADSPLLDRAKLINSSGGQPEPPLPHA